MALRSDATDLQEPPAEVSVGAVHILPDRMVVRRPDQPARSVVDESGNMASGSGIILCYGGCDLVLSIFLVYTYEELENYKAFDT